jgi:hypothetical protein
MYFQINLHNRKMVQNEKEIQGLECLEALRKTTNISDDSRTQVAVITGYHSHAVGEEQSVHTVNQILAKT